MDTPGHRPGRLGNGLPTAFTRPFNHEFLQPAGFRSGDDDRTEDRPRCQRDTPPGLADFGTGDPRGGEVVVIGEVHQVHVIGPGGVAGFPDGEVDPRDRGRGLGNVHKVAGVLPDTADPGHGGDGIVVDEAVPVRRRVEDIGAVGLVIGDDVVPDDGIDILQRGGRELLLPEPGALERVAGHRGETVHIGGNLLSGTLLVAADVGIEQRLLRILGPVQVHDQAVGLDALDVVVDFREGDVFVRNPAPGGVPAVEHDGIDGTVAGKEFLELGLDEGGMCRRERERGTDPMVGVQDGEMEHDLHPFLPQRGDEFPEHVPVQGRMHHAVIRRGGVPHAETGMVLHGDADERAPGALRGPHPLVRIQSGGIEDFRRKVRIRPVGALEGGQSEMDEHPEAQVDEFLLELVKGLGGLPEQGLCLAVPVEQKGQACKEKAVSHKVRVSIQAKV